MFLELFTLFLTLLGMLMVVNNMRPKKYPKGPFLFPVIGNLPQMMWNSRVLGKPRKELYDKYRRTYGKVYSIQLGPFP